MNNNNPFPPTAPDFSDPLGLLRACHERVFQHCDTLDNLAAHIGDKGIDLDAREAAAQVHKYFSVAGKHHHEDEEQDLFPRLARQDPGLTNLIHQLNQEHEKLDELWAQIEPQLAHPATIKDSNVFLELAQQFTDAYRMHVRKENDELLDMAQSILDSDELQQIGTHMAERRGVQINQG